jgi:hypothetical protein
MTFSFYNPPELKARDVNPFADIISNAMAWHLAQQKQKEDIAKQKLANKYYGRNIESEMGLRGAQAGHLGAMTEAQQYENQYLPEKLKAEQEKRRFEAQNPFINTAGGAGNIARLLYLKHHPELMETAQNQGMQEETISSNSTR